MNIYKITYDYEVRDTAYILVEADTPDDAADRLDKQFKQAGIQYYINNIVLLQETEVAPEIKYKKESLN